MPTEKKKTQNEADAGRDFKVGEQLKVRLHTGNIVDAKIRAVVPGRRGIKLQVDYGNDQTALIYAWQVV